MKLHLTYCFLAICSTVVSLSGTTPGQDLPSVTATVDRNKVRIADPFTAKIEVTAPSNARIQFPEISEEMGPFEILGRRERFGVVAANDPERKNWTLWLTLETLETGALEVPSVEIFVELESGKTDRIQSNPVNVNVESSIETGSDPTAFHDIRDVIDATLPEEDTPPSYLWTIVGVTTGIVVASGAAVLAIARRRHLMTPAQWVKSQLANPADLTLSDVEYTLREFVADEFDLPAKSWTTAEFEKGFANMQLADERRAQLGTFLSKAQQEKFAGLKTSAKEINEAVDMVLELVDHLHHQNREVM